MKNLSDQAYILQCTTLIEQKMQWEEGATWSNQDFEQLSQGILEKTGIILSITTLKRLWGRLKYSSSPSQTTLNALARFLDFEDWRSFVHFQKQQNLLSSEKIAQKKLTQGQTLMWSISIVSVVLLILIAIIPRSLKTAVLDISQNLSSDFQHYDAKDFSFEADKVVTEGVPNSVVFTYDATAAYTDSIFIVQTWDISRKTLVSKSKKHHSAIYYWPGFFRSKLIIGDQIVRTHDIQITSDGWLALAEQEEQPIYFTKSSIQKKEMVEVDEHLLSKNNIPLLPSAPKIRIFNQRDFGNLMNDHFTFQTTLKNSHYQGDNACQFVELLIQCKDDVFIIPLSDKTCVGDLRLYAAGHTALSVDSDLSGFGANLTEWTTVRVEVIDKKMKILVNAKVAAELSFPHSPTEIVGLQYRFYGTGAIKEAWFKNEFDHWNLFEEEKTITATL